MTFDLEMIQQVYAQIATKVDHAKKITGQHFTLAEKILYAHLDEDLASQSYERGESYVDFFCLSGGEVGYEERHSPESYAIMRFINFS